MGSNRVVIGVNDLATKVPEIALQWDYEKNGNLLPQDVACGSHQKIWWRDILGHSWRASVNSRKQGHGCPICSNRQVLPGFNDLKSQNPELADEWDYDKNEPLKPEDVTPSSGKKVWWHCYAGHSWLTSVSNRAKGKGCPVCRNKKVVAGFNDLASQNPQLAEEWDYEKNAPLTPECITPASGLRVWWHDKLGHSWKAAVYSRASGTGCPICANLQILVGFNDLASQNPRLAEEWDSEKNAPLTPKCVTASSDTMVWWRDELGHSWKASVNNRAHGSGCPICTGKQVLAGFNDLASRNPLLAGEWDIERNAPLTPEDVTLSSGRKVCWRDKLGHSWSAPVAQRSNGSECPFCTGRQVLVGFNDLASQNPQLAEEWDSEKNAPLTPMDVTLSAHKRVWWKCSFGHSWKVSVSHRSRGSSCPICKNRIVLAGFNDLETTSPELLDGWDYERNTISPSEILPNAAQKVWWKCIEGHHWRCTLSNKQRGSGCPYCNGKTPSRTHLVP